MGIEHLRHHDLDLAFLPDAGGRLVSLRFRGRELLWQNPRLISPELNLLALPKDLPPELDQASWHNFGGAKTWPAPQDRWGGPPDPVLDGGPYELSVEAGRVVLTSADDPRTGLRIVRRFDLDATNGFSQLARLENRGDAAVTWAPWEVCQVRTTPTGQVNADLGAGGEVLDLGRYVGDPQFSRDRRGVRIGVQPVVAKWGFTGPLSRIGYAGEAGTLTLSFADEPAAAYPDGGCRAQVWMQHAVDAPIESLAGWQPDADLLELEVLGPLRSLEPGEAAELSICWTVGPP